MRLFRCWRCTAIYNSSGLAYYRHADWLQFAPYLDEARQFLGFGLRPFGASATSGTVMHPFPARTGRREAVLDFTFREHSHSQAAGFSPDPAEMNAIDPAEPQTWKSLRIRRK